jgi:uncharacterized protein
VNSSEDIIRHLNRDYDIPIRDPLWGNIHISEGLRRIRHSVAFQRLNRIKQLGPAYVAYPGATHTRLNHSLGVFHISRRILQSILSSTEGTPLTLTGVRAFLCASLLHDLGHFPFAHSLKELPLESHEHLTAEMIRSEPLSSIIKNAVGTDPDFTADIVDTRDCLNCGEEVLFYRRLLSGVLDPDKLDYLCRDAFFCGVPYGTQDIDFVLTQLIPSSAGIGIRSAGIGSIEHLLFSKYLMYRSVYWHKTVRIATAMIKKAIAVAMVDSMLTPDSLYNIDDEVFFTRFTADPYPPFQLLRDMAARNLYTAVCELPVGRDFDETSAAADLNRRLELESDIAREVSRKLGKHVPSEWVIIDIPEPVHFEVDFPVIEPDGVVPFLESGSVFTRETVENFIRVLRNARLFVHPEISTFISCPKDVLQSRL